MVIGCSFLHEYFLSVGATKWIFRLSTIGRELSRILDRPTKMYSPSGDFYGVLSAVRTFCSSAISADVALHTTWFLQNGISVVEQSESPLNLIIIRTSFLSLIALRMQKCAVEIYSVNFYKDVANDN